MFWRASELFGFVMKHSQLLDIQLLKWIQQNGETGDKNRQWFGSHIETCNGSDFLWLQLCEVGMSLRILQRGWFGFHVLPIVILFCFVTFYASPATFLFCDNFNILQEDLTSAVERMLRTFGVNRYIANLGHGMHPDHEPEKLATFIETVHSFSEKLKERNSSISKD